MEQEKYNDSMSTQEKYEQYFNFNQEVNQDLVKLRQLNEIIKEMNIQHLQEQSMNNNHQKFISFQPSYLQGHFNQNQYIETNTVYVSNLQNQNFQKSSSYYNYVQRQFQANQINTDRSNSVLFTLSEKDQDEAKIVNYQKMKQNEIKNYNHSTFGEIHGKANLLNNNFGYFDYFHQNNQALPETIHNLENNLNPKMLIQQNYQKVSNPITLYSQEAQQNQFGNHLHFIDQTARTQQTYFSHTQQYFNNQQKDFRQNQEFGRNQIQYNPLKQVDYYANNENSYKFHNPNLPNFIETTSQHYNSKSQITPSVPNFPVSSKYQQFAFKISKLFNIDISQLQNLYNRLKYQQQIKKQGQQISELSDSQMMKQLFAYAMDIKRQHNQLKNMIHTIDQITDNKYHRKQLTIKQDRHPIKEQKQIENISINFMLEDLQYSRVNGSQFEDKTKRNQSLPIKTFGQKQRRSYKPSLDSQNTIIQNLLQKKFIQKSAFFPKKDKKARVNEKIRLITQQLQALKHQVDSDPSDYEDQKSKQQIIKIQHSREPQINDRKIQRQIAVVTDVGHLNSDKGSAYLRQQDPQDQTHSQLFGPGHYTYGLPMQASGSDDLVQRIHSTVKNCIKSPQKQGSMQRLPAPEPSFVKPQYQGTQKTSQQKRAQMFKKMGERKVISKQKLGQSGIKSPGKFSHTAYLDDNNDQKPASGQLSPSFKAQTSQKVAFNPFLDVHSGLNDDQIFSKKLIKDSSQDKTVKFSYIQVDNGKSGMSIGSSKNGFNFPTIHFTHNQSSIYSTQTIQSRAVINSQANLPKDHRTEARIYSFESNKKIERPMVQVKSNQQIFFEKQLTNFSREQIEVPTISNARNFHISNVNRSNFQGQRPFSAKVLERVVLQNPSPSHIQKFKDLILSQHRLNQPYPVYARQVNSGIRVFQRDQSVPELNRINMRRSDMFKEKIIEKQFINTQPHYTAKTNIIQPSHSIQKVPLQKFHPPVQTIRPNLIQNPSLKSIPTHIIQEKSLQNRFPAQNNSKSFSTSPNLKVQSVVSEKVIYNPTIQHSNIVHQPIVQPSLQSSRRKTQSVVHAFPILSNSQHIKQVSPSLQQSKNSIQNSNFSNNFQLRQEDMASQNVFRMPKNMLPPKYIPPRQPNHLPVPIQNVPSSSQKSFGNQPLRSMAGSYRPVKTYTQGHLIQASQYDLAKDDQQSNQALMTSEVRARPDLLYESTPSFGNTKDFSNSIIVTPFRKSQSQKRLSSSISNTSRSKKGIKLQSKKQKLSSSLVIPPSFKYQN